MLRKIDEYIVVALIGTGSFVFGYLLVYQIFQIVHVPGRISPYALSTAAAFLGVCPAVIYLGRTLRSLVIAAFITGLYVASLVIGSELRVILTKLWLEHMGIGTYWENVLLATIHVHILDIIFYGVWSVFLGIFVLIFTDVKKSNILLMVGLFFLMLIISMGVPNALGFEGIGHEIIRRGIFGFCFSLLIRYFLYPCSWSFLGHHKYFYQGA